MTSRVEQGINRRWFVTGAAALPLGAVAGCSSGDAKRSVVLPLSRSVLAALSVFFFLANWNAFLWPLTITSDPALRTVQVGIAGFQQQYAGNWHYILAASTVAALPMLVIFVFFQRQIVESIKSAGFK